MAQTFRVTNEDTSAITKTSADYWLTGPDGVLNMLKYLEKKLLGRSPRAASRASSVMSGGPMDPTRDIVETFMEEQNPMRRRTGSLGASSGLQGSRRARASSQGSQGGGSTLARQAMNRYYYADHFPLNKSFILNIFPGKSTHG